MLLHPASLSATLVDESIRIGTTAEGTTIKEASYLVVKDRLAQILNGAPVAVPIRSAKGCGRRPSSTRASSGPRSNS